ncbi:plastidal glycolate/glycerate translocator 1, chloroplastic, partial [Tanacetum coccineum]
LLNDEGYNGGFEEGNIERLLYLEQAFVAAAIKFQSALFGMFCKFTVLVALDVTVPAAATAVINFFEPTLIFIQKWLPLFTSPIW